MAKMIIALFFNKFLGSFLDILMQILKSHFIIFAVLLIPVLIFIYILTFVVISTLVLLVLLVVMPIYLASKTKTLAFLSGG